MGSPEEGLGDRIHPNGFCRSPFHDDGDDGKSDCKSHDVLHDVFGDVLRLTVWFGSTSFIFFSFFSFRFDRSLSFPHDDDENDGKSDFKSHDVPHDVFDDVRLTVWFGSICRLVFLGQEIKSQNFDLSQ